MEIGDPMTSIQSRAKISVDVCVAFLCLTWLVLSLRMWVRCSLLKKPGWDDWFMCIAQASFTAYCAMLLYITRNGDGTHLSKASESMFTTFDYVIADESLYVVTQVLLKISIALLFLRLVVERWQKRLIYATVIASILSGFFLFVLMFQCGTQFHYLKNQLADKCLPFNTGAGLTYFHAAVTTATDFLFTLLPVYIVVPLAVNARAKASLWLILSFGAIGSICSIVRFKYIQGPVSLDDVFWNATNLAIWSTIELGTGIIAASLVTLTPLVKKFVEIEIASAPPSFIERFKASRRIEKSFGPSCATQDTGKRTVNDPEVGSTVFDMGPVVEQWVEGIQADINRISVEHSKPVIKQLRSWSLPKRARTLRN